MTRKLLSLTTAIGMLYVYLQSQLHSADALFLVASDNIVVNLTFLTLAALAVKLSFSEPKFQSWRTYVAASVGSILAAIVGVFGLIYISIDNIFSGVLLPFDYVILLQFATIYGLFSLSYNHPPVKFKVPSYRYSIPVLRIRNQLSGYIDRAIALPGRSSGPHAV